MDYIFSHGDYSKEGGGNGCFLTLFFFYSLVNGNMSMNKLKMTNVKRIGDMWQSLRTWI